MTVNVEMVEDYPDYPESAYWYWDYNYDLEYDEY